MNLQIPPYIQGEALYSYVCRIHHLSSTRSWKETNMLLFDKPSVRLNPALPAHINTIAAVARLDPIELLLHATSYPIVSLTLPPDAKLRLAAMMRGGSGGGIASVSRTTSSRLASIRLIKACPICVETDEERYGSPVWWTKHQLYGVTACPTHLCKLTIQRAGEGGFNKQLLLPLAEEKGPVGASDKHCYLSAFLANLYGYLINASPIESLSSLYLTWLHQLGYATLKDRLRWKSLKHDMTDWWDDVFSDEEPDLPLTLKGMDFIPSLIHEDRCSHYIKHALLIAFINRTASEFFGPKSITVTDTRPHKTADLQSKDQLYNDLQTGTPMRRLATKHRHSVGYIKQFAFRHSLAIMTNPRIITDDIARTIWRKAFYGVHRQKIANEVGVSVGSVESIIQSHRGLSNWRKHLRRIEMLRKHRNNLTQCLDNNPDFTRNDVNKTVKAAYLWLYKNDREWLYSQLPPPEKSRYHASVDWRQRDILLSQKLTKLTQKYRSLSELDRLLGGHGWLLHEKARIPKTTKIAESLVRSKLERKPGS